MATIKVYELINIKNDIQKLYNIYKTNDLRTNQTQQQLLLKQIAEALSSTDIDIEAVVTQLNDKQLSKKKIEKVINDIKVYVEPFEMPTSKTIEKLFKKVKKIKVPAEEQLDLKTMTYLGFNDVSAHRKFIVYKDIDGQFKGIYGELSQTKVKGFCNICNTESDVSLFLNKSKSNSDGTYTKKGDYICYDSNVCNHNLTDPSDLYNFINHIEK